MEERLASDRRKSKRTPEGKARHLLDRMGIEGAFDFTSGNIVELAELISEVDQLRKEAAITKRIRAERDALKVCNEKLSKDNKVLRDKVSFLKANSKVIARYAELQDKDLEKKYEEFGLAVDKYSSLVDKYSRLTDERNELKEKVNSLEKELKTANLDRVATELIFKCIAR